MIRSLDIRDGLVRGWRRIALLSACVGVLCALLPIDAAAQRRFNRTYPANQNVRLQLLNRTGTVTVEGFCALILRAVSTSSARVGVEVYISTMS